MIGNNPQNLKNQVNLHPEMVLGGDFAVPSQYCSIGTSICSGPSEHMEKNQIKYSVNESLCINCLLASHGCIMKNL